MQLETYIILQKLLSQKLEESNAHTVTRRVWSKITQIYGNPHPENPRLSDFYMSGALGSRNIENAFSLRIEPATSEVKGESSDHYATYTRALNNISVISAMEKEM